MGCPHQMVKTLLGLESGHGERLRVHLTHGTRGPPRPRPRLQAQASGSTSPGVRRIPSPASPGPASGSISCCRLHPGRLGPASGSWIQPLLPARPQPPPFAAAPARQAPPPLLQSRIQTQRLQGRASGRATAGPAPPHPGFDRPPQVPPLAPPPARAPLGSRRDAAAAAALL